MTDFYSKPFIRHRMYEKTFRMIFLLLLLLLKCHILNIQHFSRHFNVKNSFCKQS
jgi:hypothetical protein